MDSSRLRGPLAGCLLAALVATPAARAQGPEPEAGVVPASVEEFRDAFVSAVRDWDVEEWAELFAEDGVMMAPSGRTVEGRDAFRELWTRSFEGKTGRNPLRVELREARIADGLAVVRADYGPEGREPVGQYVWVLERTGEGPWMLAWWMFTRKPEAG